MGLWARLLERFGFGRHETVESARSSTDALARLRERAAQANEHGRWAEAAELYLRLARAHPREPDWLHRAGKAFLRAGDRARGIEQLCAAAEAYAWRGFFAKARALCRTVLVIEPGHAPTVNLLDCLNAIPPPPAGVAALRRRADEQTQETRPTLRSERAPAGDRAAALPVDR